MQESLKYGGENLERAALAKSALLRLTQRLGIPVTQIGDLVQAVLKSLITPWKWLGTARSQERERDKGQTKSLKTVFQEIVCKRGECNICIRHCGAKSLGPAANAKMVYCCMLFLLWEQLLEKISTKDADGRT
jgi:hypothetical protein